ncbi:MAG: hypothetical protein WA996_08240 [Candidatus Promineifilaceae bacterium]
MAGNDGIVFELTIKGNIEHAYNEVISQPWDTGKDSSKSGEDELWMVRVGDDARAERELLPLLICDGQCTVTSFGR